MNLYKRIFKNLNKAKINYIVVGGVAVNLHGYQRFTGDVDILLALDELNLEKMSKLMKKMGYVERLPVQVHDLSDEKKVRNWIKTKGMTAYTFISANKPQLDIDILVEKSLNFEDFAGREEIIEVWDLRLPVISLDDLLKMKKEAGRAKDLLDLTELLRLKSEEN